jgi:DNA-binding response OmpR family regulator
MLVRVLVLDDEPAILLLVSRILGEAGYTVDVLTDPLLAPEAVQDGRYALVITNSVIEGPAGVKLIAELRRRHPTLPMLHLDDQSYPQVPEFPADVPRLTKPFGNDELVDAVRILVAGRGSKEPCPKQPRHEKEQGVTPRPSLTA